MDSRRLRYLEAMGIGVWVLRADPGRGPPAAEAPSPEVSAATVETSAVSAREVSERPVSELGWSELEARVTACHSCTLHRTRTQTVFGVGNRDADWMVIGEAPGEQEDLQGEPFVGRAGQLLNEMLRAIGLDRSAVFIANILKCRPPRNRDPSPEEAAACEPFLRRQVELVNPKIILAVGRVAAQNLLKTDTPIGKLRGQVHHYGQVPVIVTYHPAYLLRAQLEKRKAWDDLRRAREIYHRQQHIAE